MPPDLARKIYDKILADLTEKQKPNVRLEDVLGLADAAPGELTNDNVRKLGQLLGVAVPVSESYLARGSFAKGHRQTWRHRSGEAVARGARAHCGWFQGSGAHVSAAECGSWRKSPTKACATS